MAVRDAALCNGVAGHALDFDDDEPHVIVGHPSVPVVAALLAAAAERPVTFGTVLDAYLVGTGTMLRVGSVVNPRHYNAGWHCTASLGVLGAASASVYALSMLERNTANALNITTTFAGGLGENFGTDRKPLQVGAAAGNGVWSCDLARNGLRGAATAISGHQGFLAMNGGTGTSEALRGFGEPLGMEVPGFNVNVYPSCSSTHTAVDAILELLATTGWTADELESVDVWMGEDMPGILMHDIPRTGMGGKFSMRHCMAYAAIYRELEMGAFTDDVVSDPCVRALLQRVRMHIDPALPWAATGVTHQSRVQLTARNGSRVTCSHVNPIGSRGRPCSPEQLHKKFLSCAGYGLTAPASQLVWNGVSAISEEDRSSDLLDVVRAGVEQCS